MNLILITEFINLKQPEKKINLSPPPGQGWDQSNKSSKNIFFFNYTIIILKWFMDMAKHSSYSTVYVAKI